MPAEGGMRRVGLRRHVRRRPDRRPWRNRDHRREGAEPGRPRRSLPAHRRQRFGKQDIGEQGGKAAGIAGRIQEIGIVRPGVPATREPRLQQRTVRRHGEERRAHRHGEQAGEPQGLARFRRRVPAGGKGDRQEGETGRHCCELQDRSRPQAEPGRKEMRPGVAGEQGGLEKHHGDRPDRRRAAKPGQRHAGKEGLHREQQEGAEENRRAEGGQQQGVGNCPAPCAAAHCRPSRFLHVASPLSPGGP